MSAFVADVDRVTDDIVRVIDATPSTAGIDQAQEILDAKRADLKSRYHRLNDLPRYQLSNDLLKEFTEGISRNMEAVANLQIKHGDKSFANQTFGKKMNKLYRDYSSIFGV